MSLAQILEEVKTFPTADLESLEQSLRRQRLQREKRVLGEEETRLFSVVNAPLPDAERLRELRTQREQQTLSEAEHAELMRLENEREIAWAGKLRAVARLADVRGEEFDALYQQLGLNLRAEN